nr:hypothetical protein [Tanacetum cinerariifolium]
MSNNGFDGSEIIRVLAGQLITVAAMAYTLLVFSLDRPSVVAPVLSSRSGRSEMKKLYACMSFELAFWAFGNEEALCMYEVLK